VEIATLNDLRLMTHAMKEGWNISQEKRDQIVAALMTHLVDPDPKYSIQAAKALMAADAIDAKRESVDKKIQEIEHDRRLRLLELAKRIPVGELAKLASDHGTVVDATSKRVAER
jgi:hypothetical protein